ncbi:MAG: 50S ribosomal protein L17 [Candidatus Saccharimonadales bacterium]
MHRHGYKGRKFGRERDQRKALIKGLATSLVLHTSIETTLEKAKETLPYVETLITKAKKGGLHNRRQVISGLSTLEAAYKLFDQIAPQLTTRDSGHLRVKRTRLRVGDNAQLARVSFVDELKETPVAATTAVVAKPAAKPVTKPAAKTAAKSAARKTVTTKKGDN